jgi:hypothetical protein
MMGQVFLMPKQTWLHTDCQQMQILESKYLSQDISISNNAETASLALNSKCWQLQMEAIGLVQMWPSVIKNKVDKSFTGHYGLNKRHSAFTPQVHLNNM